MKSPMAKELSCPPPELSDSVCIPRVDRRLELAGLEQNGGLIVIGETVVTLHKEISKLKVY